MVTTSVVGDLFVVHDPAGELVTTVAEQTSLDWVQIHALLRASAGDHYDFMSCYLDIGSGVVDLGSASDFIHQDATGIGRWVFTDRPSWGTAKLQHYAFFSFFNLTTFLHEVGHRWLATVNYADVPNGAPVTLLHQDWIWAPGDEVHHWGRWLDNGNSSMDYDQAEWVDNGDGTFNRIDRNPGNPTDDQWFGYSPLDQYLMGFLPPGDVPPFKVIGAPSPTPTEGGPFGVPTGPYTPTAGVTTVTIAKVQNTRPAEPSNFSGPRNPTYLTSQRVFHEAVVVVTKSTSTTTPFISLTDTRRRATTPTFRRATAGRALIDSSLLRPNYAALYTKDNPADIGSGTTGAPFWHSPDLWVRNIDDGGALDQPTMRGQSNWIHVRVRNKSAQPYQNVTVSVYLGNFLDLVPGTEFLYPVDWNPDGLLGSAVIPSVPAASGTTHGEAIAKFEWTAAQIPSAVGWHPCLLSEVIPMEVTPLGLHHVYENRKLGQRNITILDPSMAPKEGGSAKGGIGGMGGAGYYFASEFWVGHSLRPAHRTRLRIRAERHLPELIRLFLDPAGLIEDLAADAEPVELEAPLETLVEAVGDAYGETGGRGGRVPREGYELRGLRPVVVNGLPLLEVTDPEDASFVLPLERRSRHKLRVLGIVHADRGTDQSGLYHVTEERNRRTVGGVCVEIRVRIHDDEG